MFFHDRFQPHNFWLKEGNLKWDSGMTRCLLNHPGMVGWLHGMYTTFQGWDTQIWLGRGCATRPLKPLHIFKSHLAEKGTNFQGFFSKYRSTFHNFQVFVIPYVFICEYPPANAMYNDLMSISCIWPSIDDTSVIGVWDTAWFLQSICDLYWRIIVQFLLCIQQMNGCELPISGHFSLLQGHLSNGENHNRAFVSKFTWECSFS